MLRALACAPVLLSALSALAQTGAGSTGLAGQKLNPLAYGINVPIQLSLGYGYGPHHATQPAVSMQPLVPFGINDDWRVVTRSNISVGHLPSPERATGFGDFELSLFVSPARTGAWVWGAGPVLQAPSATRPALGTGRWSLGPTAALLYVDGPWVNGIVASHRVSFAGQQARDRVRLTQIELQVSYTLDDDWYIQSNPTLSYDWEGTPSNRSTIPLGLDVGRAFRMGSQGASFQIGAYKNVKRPDGAADWTLLAQFSLLY